MHRLVSLPWQPCLGLLCGDHLLWGAITEFFLQLDNLCRISKTQNWTTGASWGRLWGLLFPRSVSCFRKNFWPHRQNDVSLVDQLQVSQKAGITGQLLSTLLCRSHSFRAWTVGKPLNSKGLFGAQLGERDRQLGQDIITFPPMKPVSANSWWLICWFSNF